MRYQNPIIPGFYPDPSICRAGKDYYLVTSSFEYFPGVPLFHSRDLVHWQQIGHCLTRASQLPLGNTHSSGGIYAPTIRHHQQRFYMVTTNVTAGKHFFVHADNPRGEWSEPIWIDRTGIDPSLFFDDDGRTYFTWTMDGGIYQSEIDIATGALTTPDRLIWAGTGGRYPEAPHLYKISGLYYLMIAEGGTEYGHMETIARANNPYGPFEVCPRNPILTHRNLGGSVIQGTGHADLIEAHDGRWWAVFLAFRCLTPFGQYHHLGRETFLAPVTWDADGWPVINGDGTVTESMEADGLPLHPFTPDPIRDDFTAPSLRLCWNFLRNPPATTWSLNERPGWLRLKGSAHTLDDTASPAFVGRRQQHARCKVSARLDFSPQSASEEAGLTVLINETHHYELAITYRAGVRRIFVRRRIGDLTVTVCDEPLAAGIVELRITAAPDSYAFAYTVDGHAERKLATASTRYLSSEVAGGFTGVYFAMYATGNGEPATTAADFDWFDYLPADTQDESGTNWE